MQVIGVIKDRPPRLQMVALVVRIANQVTSVRLAWRHLFHVHLEPITQERKAPVLLLVCNALKDRTVRTMQVQPIRLVPMDSIARLACLPL